MRVAGAEPIGRTCLEGYGSYRLCRTSGRSAQHEAIVCMQLARGAKISYSNSRLVTPRVSRPVELKGALVLPRGPHNAT
jgi:hypothetical protein